MKRTPKTTGAEAPEKPKAKSNAGRKDVLINAGVIEAMRLLVEGGATNQDVIEKLGISPAGFYGWLATGRATKGLEAFAKNAPTAQSTRALCVEFLEAYTRARAAYRLFLISSINAAVDGREVKEHHEETFTETRINPKTGEPYQYTRYTTRDVTKELLPDGKLALAVIERRAKADWSARSEVVEVDIEAEAVRMIKAGEIDYDSLVNQFKDESLVKSWFELAGIDPLNTDEESTNG